MRFGFFSRLRRDRELEEEIRAHLAMAVRDRIARGEDPEEAEHAARREFGNEALVRELTHRMWGWSWLEHFGQDLRYALHSIRKSPGFSAVVVLTLALGVGPTAVVFGMTDHLLLRPLPGVHDSGRAYYLRLHAPGESDTVPQHNLSMPAFEKLRHDATLLDGIAAYGFNVFEASASGARAPVVAAMIDGDYFDVLGVQPSAGRLLSAAGTGPAGNPFEAVISQTLSVRLFGSAASAVGKTMRVNDKVFTVVGVAGGGFKGSQRFPSIDLWIPYAGAAAVAGFSPEILQSSAWKPLGLFVARLRNGVSVQDAEAQLTRLVHQAVREVGGGGRNAGGTVIAARLTPGIGTQPNRRPGIVRSLRLLAVVVALVLLIACGNVANLLLFRNVARRGATATRRALGASSGRIAREHLAWSGVLAMLGVAVGLCVGWLISLVLGGQSLEHMPAFTGLVLDRRVLLFAASAAVGTALLFGAAPAILAGRFDLAGALRRASGRGTGRLATIRAALPVGQLGLTLALVVGALLLLRTMRNLYAASTGLDIHDVSYMMLEHAGNLDAAQLDALDRNLLTAVQAVPGVQKAALGPADLEQTKAVVVGPADATTGQRFGARLVPVTPGWFDTYRIAPVRGRLLRDGDWHEGGAIGAVITASLAHRLFGAAPAVGRTLSGKFGGSTKEMHVIGVVSNLSSVTAPNVAEDAVFVSYAAAPRSIVFYLLVRTRGLTHRTQEAIRKAVHSVFPTRPVAALQPVSRMVEASRSERKILSHLLILLAALAAVLSTVGLYGIIAFVVAGRRREFGIRVALGAEAWRIARLVLRSGIVIIGAGTLFGLGGAYVLSRVLRSQLFGVGTLDPTSYLGGAVLLALIAATACWIPARRATRADPVEALREE